MAHTHSVYDNDTHFKIDPVTRKIENTTDKTILMQNDHNSERFTFELPRYIDGHDMSVCNKVEVHFINIKAEKTEKHQDIYTVADLELSPDSTDVVICSWLVSQNATKYAGSLNFVLRFACLTGSTIDYQWFTDIYSGISISASIYNGEAIATDYADILEEWREELKSVAGGALYVKITKSGFDVKPSEIIKAYEDSRPVFALWEGYILHPQKISVDGYGELNAVFSGVRGNAIHEVILGGTDTMRTVGYSETILALEDNLPKVLLVTIDSDQDGLFADKTLEEIVEAHHAGRVVRAYFGNLYDLRSLEEGDDYTIAYFDAFDTHNKTYVSSFTISNFGDGDVIEMHDNPPLATIYDIPEGGGGATPDFNAAPGEQGHILNRTHYDEWVEILPETAGEYYDSFTRLDLVGNTPKLIAGDTYRVIVNGVSYESVATPIEADAVYLGNYEGMEGIGEGTGEPYVVVWIPVDSVMMCVCMEANGEAATFSLYHRGAVHIPQKYMAKPCVVSFNYEDFTIEYGEITTGGTSRNFRWASLTDREYDVSGIARAWVENRPIILEIYSETDGVRIITSRFMPTSFSPYICLAAPEVIFNDPDKLNTYTSWHITASGQLVNGTTAEYIDITLGYVDLG